MKRLRFRPNIVFLSMIIMAFSAIPSARSQEVDDSAPPPDNAGNVRVARLSFFYGAVQVERPGTDWQDAQANLPLEGSSKVRTEDGRAELQFDDGSILRLAQSTTAELTELALVNGRAATKIDILSGTAILVGRISGGETFRVVTPSIDVDVPNGVSFRVDATDGNSWVTVMTGNLQITTSAGINPVTGGNMLHLGADGQMDVEANPAPDDFDTWSVDRDRMLAGGYATAAPYVQQYEPEFYDAAADLSAYGYWGNISGCGSCWMPYGVSARWMPFGLGSWCYYGNLGWTWISAEPWGWLPYHYGKWFFTTHGWAWSPNPVRRFNPGAVDWIKVNGKTAWVPAGSFASARRPEGAAGYVTGTEAANGVIRSERGTGHGGPVETSAPIIISARPPAASLLKNGEAVPAKTIVYDPTTRTYVNGEPKRTESREAEPRNTERRASPKGDEAMSDQSRAMRPTFGAPSTYAPAMPVKSAPISANEESSRPERGPSASVPRPASGSVSAPASGWHAAAPARPMSQPVHSAPAPTAHASSAPTPHH
jgi:hypothetical protein